jgi:flagellar basal-body rod protein FlgB
MPPVSGVGPLPSVQPPSGGGHGDHGAAVSNGGAQPSFSSALAQAIGLTPGGSAANSVPSGGAHPRHFTIGEPNHGGKHGLQEIVMGLRLYRQELIASNIANADTPGYKAVDVDFQEALRIASSAANTSPLTLVATAAGHIPGQAQSSAPPYPLRYHTPAQPSADGNTVDMDVERSKFAENSVMWEFSRDRVSGHAKMMMEMLQNLKN